MASAEDESGLFAIDLDLDTLPSSPKLPRDHQSEADFLELKNTWTPKVETGNIATTLKLPIENATKQDSQSILHAIEELYFEGKYKEGASLTQEVLKDGGGGEVRWILEKYLRRCEEKLSKKEAPGKA